MENLQAYADELEELILDSLDGGLTFKASKLEDEWNKLHPSMPFKSVITVLFSQNKVGAVAKDTYEYRFQDRTD